MNALSRPFSLSHSLPRQTREELQKAFGFLKRGEPERAVACMLRVLRGLRTASPSVLQLAETGIRNFLALLVEHPRVHVLLEGLGDQETSGQIIPYRAGKEGALSVVLDGLLSILREQEQVEKEADDCQARADRRAHLLAAGRRYLSLGQIRVACAFFDRLLTEFPPAVGGGDGTLPVVLEAGRALEEADLLREAKALYERTAELYPKEPSVYRALTDVLVVLKDFDQAEGWLQKALVVFGEHPKTLLRLALILEQADRRKEALGTVRRVLALDDSLAEAHKLLSRLTLQELPSATGTETGEDTGEMLGEKTPEPTKKRAVSL